MLNVQADRGWRRAALGFCLLMGALHVAAGWNTAGFADFWRDMYWATRIATGEAFPLHGPQVYQFVELGPWWFYLLAVPLALTGSVAWASVFTQALAALQYWLGWRLGLRLGGARLGFAFAVSLALAGWSVVPLLFPSHPALTGTCLLLLGLFGVHAWERFGGRQAVLLGLVAAACVHAHPTTASLVVALGLALLWRHRSAATVGWLALAALLCVLSLLPPWLDRAPEVTHALKGVDAYLADDVAHATGWRLLAVLRGLVVDGAWWGLLLLTPLPVGLAKALWWLWLAALGVGFCGLGLLRGQDRRLFRLAMAAAGLFVFQAVFLVLLRPITPMWMVSGCMPLLALVMALGWLGWLRQPSRRIRTGGLLVLVGFTALSLLPWSIALRRIDAMRGMAGANPLLDIRERGNTVEETPVPFYPVRRYERLATSLCGPAVLHGRLAGMVEISFAVPLRLACGYWPDLRYGGVAGEGAHITGLLPRVARASGITPQRMQAGLAFYDRARPVAPAEGGHARLPARLQINPQGAPGPARDLEWTFEAGAGDALVITNRLPFQGQLWNVEVTVAGTPAVALGSDGSSTVWRCQGCRGETAVWTVRAHAIEGNLDLVVLPAPD